MGLHSATASESILATSQPKFQPFPVSLYQHREKGLEIAPGGCHSPLTIAPHPFVVGAYQLTSTVAGKPFGGAFSRAEAAWIAEKFDSWDSTDDIPPQAFGAVAERAIAYFKELYSGAQGNGN
jgi:hypothetical protein